MRLIDADALEAKILMETPDFMDGGSSLAKAFILAMIKTRSVTPTVDAVPVVRCNDCKWYSAEISWCNNSMSPKEQTFFCADGKRREEDA